MSYSEKAVAALEKADLKEIEKNVDLAIEKDTKEYLLALQEILLQAGYTDLSKKVIETLLKEDPNCYDVYISLAEIAMEDNDIEKAFELLDSIPSDSEQYVPALIVLADLYQMIGVPEVSEQKLLEAQRLEEDPLIDFALGELYYSNQNYEAAKTVYHQLLQQEIYEIANISIIERLSELYMRMGDFESAIPLLEETLKQQDNSQMKLFLAIAYYKTDETEKAMRLFKSLVESDPELSATYYYLAEGYMAENQLQAAQEVAETGLKYEPLNIGLYTLLAEIMYRNHDVKEAEHYLKQALEIEDFNGGDQAKLALATMYINEERSEEALEILQQVNETDGYVHWLMAQAYRMDEEYEKAMEHYEAAAVEMDHDLGFMRDYGLMLREEGRQEEANQWLLHYIEHEPTDMEIASLLEE